MLSVVAESISLFLALYFFLFLYPRVREKYTVCELIGAVVRFCMM